MKICKPNILPQKFLKNKSAILLDTQNKIETISKELINLGFHINYNYNITKFKYPLVYYNEGSNNIGFDFYEVYKKAPYKNEFVFLKI